MTDKRQKIGTASKKEMEYLISNGEKTGYFQEKIPV